MSQLAPDAGTRFRAQPQPGLTLSDRLRVWRSGVIAHPGFRRFATRFLPTRFVARREAAALFDLCAGFVYAQVLSAFVKLGLPEMLLLAPRTAQEAARLTGLGSERTETLLRAAASLRLAERLSGNRYGLGPRGAALIGNDGVRAMIAHHELLYGDLADPVGLLRKGSGRLSSFWDYGGDRSSAAAYSKLMAASQDFVAAEILDAVDLKAARRLMDVGGGTGAFVEAAARRHQHLALTLLDLPPVAELARRRLATAGLGSRVDVGGIDFAASTIPAGADVVTLVRVLHDHDDAPALSLLKAIRLALPPDGRLVIAEPMSDEAGREPAGDAYFGFYLLAMGRGRPRRFSEIAAMAQAAGFTRISAVPTATPVLIRIACVQP